MIEGLHVLFGLEADFVSTDAPFAKRFRERALLVARSGESAS